MSELATIQRWLTSIIVRPGTLNDKIQLADDHYKLKNERVIRQSGRLASAEKIEIYSRGYFLRLLECMEAEYPALKNLLGEEVFQTFVRVYLIHQPPSSFNLFNLGESLPAFLKASQPRNNEMENDVFDLPVDIALLERTISEVSRMEGLEGGGAVAFDKNPMLYLFDNSAIKPSPCLKLLKLQYPVAEFVKSIYRQDEPQIPNKQISYIAVSRKNYRVFFYELDEWQWFFLFALKNSENYLEATSAASLQCGIPVDNIMADLILWLPIALDFVFVYK